MITLLLACSFGPRPGVCIEDQECRSAFGFGFSCGEEGYCEEVAINPRCATSYPTDLLVRPEDYGDALVFADLFQTQFDGPMIRSAELAIREADENGELDGRKIAVLHCDNDDSEALGDIDGLTYDEATPVLAAHVVRDLGVQAIIGPSSSGAALEAYTAIEPLGAMLISPSASSPLLTTADGEGHTDDDPGLLWRTVPPDDLQALAMVQDFASRSVSSIFIINQVGVYGTALSDAVAFEFEDSGGAVSRSSFESDSERAAAIGEIPTDPATEVVFISSAVDDIVSFVDAIATDPDFATRPIFLSDAGADPYLTTEASQAAKTEIFKNIRGTRPQIPNGPVFDLYKIAYSGTYDGEDPSSSVYAAYSYDATWLALYGAAYAVTQPPITGLGIAQGMRRTVNPEALAPTPIQASSWPTVIDTFAAGGRIEVEGASGPLDFDPVTGEVSNPIEVWVIAGDAPNGPFTFDAVSLCRPGEACVPIP